MASLFPQQKLKINFCSPREMLELPGIDSDMCDKILNMREHKDNITAQDLLIPELLDVVDFEPYCREGQDTSYGIPSDPLMPILSRVNDTIANATLTSPQRYEQPQNIPQRWVGNDGRNDGSKRWGRAMGQVQSGRVPLQPPQGSPRFPPQYRDPIREAIPQDRRATSAYTGYMPYDNTGYKPYDNTGYKPYDNRPAMVPMVKMEPQMYQPTFQPIPQADLGAYDTSNRPYFLAQSIPYQGRSQFWTSPATTCHQFQKLIRPIDKISLF